jgi:hypothetical protein
VSRRLYSTDDRDRALARLRRVNRGVAAGALVLTLVFAEAAAQAFPGKKAHARLRAARRPSTKALAPPTTAPQTAEGETSEGTGTETPPSSDGQSVTPEGTQSQAPEETTKSSEPAQETGSGTSSGSEPTHEEPAVSGGS